MAFVSGRKWLECRTEGMCMYQCFVELTVYWGEGNNWSLVCGVNQYCTTINMCPWCVNSSTEGLEGTTCWQLKWASFHHQRSHTQVLAFWVIKLLFFDKQVGSKYKFGLWLNRFNWTPRRHVKNTFALTQSLQGKCVHARARTHIHRERQTCRTKNTSE